jgi:hypothetical protein
MDARTANQIQMLSLASAPVVSFRCECGDVTCRRTIPLSPVSYREHRAHDDPVLYPGHEVVAASVATRATSWTRDRQTGADSAEDEPLAGERDWLARRSDAR